MRRMVRTVELLGSPGSRSPTSAAVSSPSRYRTSMISRSRFVKFFTGAKKLTARLRYSAPMNIKRNASAQWNGGLKDGKGSISTASGVLQDTQYSFGTRFENGAGTNPEELIAAAHAGCFSMALSAGLEKAGHPATRVHTTASVRLDTVGEGF